MTDINIVRKLTNAELELIAGGTRGGETTGNSNNVYESGVGISYPNDPFPISETVRNQ